MAFAGSLEAAAAWAAGVAPASKAPGRPHPGDPPAVTPGAIRGLFSGGTLCYEAMAVVAGVVGRVASNIPLRAEWRLADPHRSEGHTFVDFGDDAMTEGRAHPMIDPGLRNERFRREAADPETGVVLLDVVLGHGAHPDPAGELAPLVERAVAGRPGRLSVVVSLCGAAGDPQGLDAQAATLRAAGALVTRSSAQAARLALAAAGSRTRLGRPPAAPGGRCPAGWTACRSGLARDQAARVRGWAAAPRPRPRATREVDGGERAAGATPQGGQRRGGAVRHRAGGPAGRGGAGRVAAAGGRGRGGAGTARRPRREVAAANDRAVAAMQAAEPRVVGIGRAGDLLPDLDGRTLLHAGPPIGWADMCGPLRGAIIGAAIYEGMAADPEEAARLAERGGLRFGPCHDRGAVGPMAGVVSASMPVWIVEHGDGRAFCTLNEGLGKVLRYGAYDAQVLDRLAWMRDVLARVLAAALARLDEPLDLRALIAQALQMGDEGHNRNRAGTSLLLRALLPALLTVEEPTADVVAAAEFISGNDHFFLNLAMAAGKATADAAAGTAGASIVTAMARNGTEFGVRLAGTGDRWFTGPAGVVDGLYLPGFGPEDANRDIGDSTITETIGIGGMAMAAAPAIVRFVGGTPDDAVAATLAMYDITWAESASYQLPALGFRGTPLGIDCREVVHTGVLPTVNTGIAHKDPGVGQVGAGLVEPPMEAFVAATRALAASAADPGRPWPPCPPTSSPPRSWSAWPATAAAWSWARAPPPPGSTWTGSWSPSPPARSPSSPTPSAWPPGREPWPGPGSPRAAAPGSPPAWSSWAASGSPGTRPPPRPGTRRSPSPPPPRRPGPAGSGPAARPRADAARRDARDPARPGPRAGPGRGGHRRRPRRGGRAQRGVPGRPGARPGARGRRRPRAGRAWAGAHPGGGRPAGRGRRGPGRAGTGGRGGRGGAGRPAGRAGPGARPDDRAVVDAAGAGVGPPAARAGRAAARPGPGRGGRLARGAGAAGTAGARERPGVCGRDRRHRRPARRRLTGTATLPNVVGQ